MLRVARVRATAQRKRPPTLPSRLASNVERLRDPRPTLHVLHVGKTGGTALKHALLEHIDDSAYRLLLHGHDVTLAHIPRGERFMFALRDPISRFVSAFNGRFRADHPRFHYPWRDEEQVAFRLFRTPDALATALSSRNELERASAQRAMRGIGHVNTPYEHWFGDVRFFRTRLSDVFFVAFQEQLDDDFELLKRRLDLPTHARLPSDPIAAHRSLATVRTSLGEVAHENLARWYETDFRFLRFCHELAPLVNADEFAPERASPFMGARREPNARRWPALRIVLLPLVGVAAFAATGALAETFTDRDWRLSGLEWPTDFATAAGLACLVPVALSALSALVRAARPKTRAVEDS